MLSKDDVVGEWVGGWGNGWGRGLWGGGEMLVRSLKCNNAQKGNNKLNDRSD